MICLFFQNLIVWEDVSELGTPDITVHRNLFKIAFQTLRQSGAFECCSVEEGSSLLYNNLLTTSTGEATLGVVCSFLSSPVQERKRHIGNSL